MSRCRVITLLLSPCCSRALTSASRGVGRARAAAPACPLPHGALRQRLEGDLEDGSRQPDLARQDGADCPAVDLRGAVRGQHPGDLGPQQGERQLASERLADFPEKHDLEPGAGLASAPEPGEAGLDEQTAVDHRQLAAPGRRRQPQGLCATGGDLADQVLGSRRGALCLDRRGAPSGPPQDREAAAAGDGPLDLSAARAGGPRCAAQGWQLGVRDQELECSVGGRRPKVGWSSPRIHVSGPQYVGTENPSGPAGPGWPEIRGYRGPECRSKAQASGLADVSRGTRASRSGLGRRLRGPDGQSKTSSRRLRSGRRRLPDDAADRSGNRVGLTEKVPGRHRLRRIVPGGRSAGSGDRGGRGGSPLWLRLRSM